VIILAILNSCNNDSISIEDEEALDYSMRQIGEEWDGTRVYNNPNNPFLQKIPDDYEVHEFSAEMIAHIKQQTGPNFTNTRLSTGDFSIPVFLATESTPVRDIHFNLYGNPPGKSHMIEVPFLIGSNPAKGSDQHYTIIQQESGCVYEFWRFDYNTAGGGNAIPLSSNGIYEDGRSSVASGWSNLQGIIWPKELKELKINHALSFSVPITHAAGYVSPATKHDGVLQNDYAIPEGTLVRIQPDYDIDQIPNISPIEKAVYEAVQTYGMYCGDTNGAGVAIRAVSPRSVYADSFPEELQIESNSNYSLPNFPFDALEVVSGGPLIPYEQREYIDHGCANWR
jgi:hypothetical protein